MLPIAPTLIMQAIPKTAWRMPRIASPSFAIASFLTSASDVEAFEAQANAMESTLASDFADGRVGMRYHTYAHR